MKRITMARFKCISCNKVELVELEHFGDDTKLPLGWCGLKGWWLEGIPSETEGKVAQDKVPLDIECCSYECMEKFFKENILNPELRSNVQTPCEVGTPQAEEKLC